LKLLISDQMQGRLENLGYRLRLTKGAPNILGTESSFNPPIGHNWAAGELPRGYYIDFRDKPWAPVWPPQWMEPRRDQFGVSYAQWGLGAHERYLDGEGEEWLAAARGAAEYILSCLEDGGPLDGAWLHLRPMPHTFPVSAPWISAMAQGECASLLTRIYLATGDEEFAEGALRALKTMRLPVVDGGCLAEIEGRPMLEEYPTQFPSAVLNGAIFAIWGLYDVGRGLDDADASRFFEECADGLAAVIDRYDLGWWSRYDLYPHPRPNVATPAYHLLHINQLTALSALAPRPQWNPVIENFEAYRENPNNRRRAFAEKVAFRIVRPRNQLLAHRMPGIPRDTAPTPADRADAMVLCYHAVSETWPAKLSIHPDLLREQLRELKKRGYKGVTFSELVSGKIKGRIVAITFDDGYRSVIELAQPILAEEGFPGTLFVPTRWIGTGRPMAWPGIEQWLGTEHEPELIPMGWDEVRQLRDAGWEIGSHTSSHPKLSQIESDRRLAVELVDSRDRCIEELGSCETIAYPYGDHDQRVMAAAADAGYLAAATLPEGSPTPRPLAWPRVGIYVTDDMRAFRIKTSATMRRARAASYWPYVAGGLRRAKRLSGR
jgi:peptidoglycan/xylan/chitin deacetylase (PgdA/CDA1 family)